MTAPKGKARAQRRPTISSTTILSLWARAAGRCEFRGCNALLYQDRLTKQQSNLAVVSHIVACSSDGPRGDPVRSPALATDLANLMLTCRNHGKVIDDHALVAAYPETLLLEFKREHEDRIRMLTAIAPDAQTHVLVLEAPLRDRSVRITDAEAFHGILPRYPADERAARIALGAWAYPGGDRERWQIMAEEVTRHVTDAAGRWDRAAGVTNVSVFAIAPIPLLVHLGRMLGDVRQVELYQRHRTTQDWRWLPSEPADEWFRQSLPDASGEHGATADAAVVVVLSISGPVDAAAVARTSIGLAAGSPRLAYELRANDCGYDFMRSRTRLEAFGLQVRRLLGVIRERHGHGKTVHLMPALPAPAAIEFGRNLKTVDGPVIVYEFDPETRAYAPALTVNATARHPR